MGKHLRKLFSADQVKEEFREISRAKTLSDKGVLCQLKRDTAACRDLLERPMRHMTALQVHLASCEISTLRNIENEE